MTNPRKRGIQSVVVFLSDRIELVVVTPRTSKRHAQKSFAGCANDFIQRVGANLSRLCGILISNVVIGSGDEKSGTHSHVRVVVTKYITRNVFADELVERFVFVDRANDIIAKRPDVVDNDIPLVPDAFPKTNDIQPVPAPAFTVVR